MTKKLLVAALVTGIFLILAAVLMTVMSARSANVIGGAGWPTLQLYFRTTGADWLAFFGVPMVAVAAVLLAILK